MRECVVGYVMQQSIRR